ncbi:nucleolar transcription factor 1 isoform X1 [Scleropages formosus]|uniref:nucleolar transcription factor 1 isoform X1 n=1 Tax=Scleropages formosus TaxID=113540 RepID=UPI0008789B9D|nr:nucleolar transcription factor 1 isoform X1 [Scleropages formosus]XP_029110038.1 nucleolar transcription factor 1 isoform X1 [Scleropages formosus]XP_029110039.1 nucleolar transcription factor 1 isoform X1 [Scleropages formosus]
MDASASNPAWASDDLLKLLESMREKLPQKDVVRYKTAESRLDWDEVAFGHFSGEECKRKWLEVSRQVRRFRTLTELIADVQELATNPHKGKTVKKHPDFPKKPLTAYFRFFKEKRAKYAKLHPEISNLELTKVLSKKYRELSDRKKAKYSEAFHREKEIFEQQLLKFQEEHPDLAEYMKRSEMPQKPKTPQQLWYNHKKKSILKINPEATTKEIKESVGKQWAELSNKKKLKWINKALEQQKVYEEAMREFIQQHPERNLSESNIKKVTLTKAERQLKDKFDGRPDKPPPNGFSLYCTESMVKMTEVPYAERIMMCSQQWKQLKQSERDTYQERCKQKKKEYEVEMECYVKSLPEEEQQRVLAEVEAEQNASRKRSRPKRDSDSTKRPISAMFIYKEEKRPKLQKQRPDLSESEVAQLLERMWTELPDKKKKKYARLEETLKVELKKAVKGKQASAATPNSKKAKIEGESKKPLLSGYQAFSQELCAGKELDHLSLKERSAEIKGRWQKMPQHEKDRYTAAAEKMQNKNKGLLSEKRAASAKNKSSVSEEPEQQEFSVGNLVKSQSE